MQKLSNLSKIANRFSICPLSRKVLRVCGKDAVALVQGLTTNDIFLLNKKKLANGSSNQFLHPSLFTLLLSVEGRVLFDTIVHRCDGEALPSLYLEADNDEIDTLVQHVKRYKMRKKVDLKVMDDLIIYAGLTDNIGTEDEYATEDDFVESSPGFVMGTDPRAPHFGLWRLITSTRLEDNLSGDIVVDENTYKVERYKLGIAEGPNEITRNKALPLNHNVDVMNGVCFSKGCYLGQELTARTHHTGVIRRRVFPVQLSKPIPGNDGPSNLVLHHEEDGSKMGNMICTQGVHGLAMLKVDHSFKPMRALSDTIVTPTKPFWYPRS